MDLIPRLPKRKRQPSAGVMREQLALAANEIIRLRSLLALPLWKLIWLIWRKRA